MEKALLMKIDEIKNTILLGDCLEVLKQLPDESVNCCVTSPPYWGLRDYKEDNQLGLEKTPEEYIDKMVQIFSEMRRVLRKDGTCWVNLGDSYNSTNGFCRSTGTWAREGRIGGSADKKQSYSLKHKELVGIPWRFAFAAREEGWYLRQDIIWNKPNPMPESCTDRCTKAHEYIFLLTKSARYWYDADAIREPHSQAIKDGVTQDEMETAWRANRKSKGKVQADTSGKTNQGGTVNRNKNYYGNIAGRNKRSVWTVIPSSFKCAHFATYPPDLIKPCILAGCPEGGIVLDPFMGAGTTGVVAYQNNRDYIGIELNLEYKKIADKRIQKEKDKLVRVPFKSREQIVIQ